MVSLLGKWENIVYKRVNAEQKDVDVAEASKWNGKKVAEDCYPIMAINVDETGIYN